MHFNSKGMTCGEFVELMRDRGITYSSTLGRFVTKRGEVKGKQNRNGYRTIALSKNHISYTFCEHRCVWVWFNGDIPEGFEVNHIDANRSNNHIENLEIVDHSGNMRHAISIGNFVARKAQESGKAIYTNEEVLAMRCLYDNGWKIFQIQDAFGAKYNMSISRLIRGERYGSVHGSIGIERAEMIAAQRKRKEAL